MFVSEMFPALECTLNSFTTYWGSILSAYPSSQPYLVTLHDSNSALACLRSCPSFCLFVFYSSSLRTSNHHSHPHRHLPPSSLFLSFAWIHWGYNNIQQGNRLPFVLIIQIHIHIHIHIHSQPRLTHPHSPPCTFVQLQQKTTTTTVIRTKQSLSSFHNTIE